MSLLWRNHLRISLCADRVVVANYRRGLRPGKPRNSVFPVKAVEQAPDWRAALDALPEALGALARERPDVSVILADQFVKYALLPWNSALKTDEQWLALARHRLAAVHGAKVADWDLRITDTGPNAPRLACALDRGLLRELGEKLSAAGMNLVSVQPFLVAAFNHIRGAVGNGSCWLVVEEPGRLTLALIQNGVWTAIRSRRADERWRKVLTEILERESAFLALPEACTRVFVCAQGDFDTDVYETWTTRAFDYPEVALAWA